MFARAERLVRAIEDTTSAVRGLPVLNQDRVWERIPQVGLEELLQFDWTLVGEADGLSGDLAAVFALDEVDAARCEARLRRIREVIGDRQRYLEVQA